MEDCPICCEDYNNSTRAAVKCECGDCEYTACKTCQRQYLTNTTTDPHCMKCRGAWSQGFMVRCLNRSFVAGDFRKHRSALLLEKEIAKMPDTMEAAERYKRWHREEKVADRIRDQVLDLKVQIRALQTTEWEHRDRVRALRYGKAELEEKKRFIMPCPHEACRGFLSTQYKCEICQLHTCSKCFNIIGHNKTDDHECDAGDVASAELIKKETKGCPSCGTRICKIDGCDQMWCVECHQAFSWRTGRIDNGTVHNPHFYQFQRTQNNGQVPRNPADVPCGGLCGWHQLRTHVLNKIYVRGEVGPEGKSLYDRILALHRVVAHITNHDVPDTRRRVEALGDSESLRIDYIIGERSKEELGNTVCRNDILRRKYTEMLHIYDLLSTVGIDLFRTLVDGQVGAPAAGLRARDPEFEGLVTEQLAMYEALRIYCNEQFVNVSVTFNQTVPQMSEYWTITKRKYNLSTAKEHIAALRAMGGEKGENAVIGTNAFTEGQGEGTGDKETSTVDAASKAGPACTAS